MRETLPEETGPVVLNNQPAPPNTWALMILIALQRGPMYEGTVPRAVKTRRRIKNRKARKARAITRGDSR